MPEEKFPTPEVNLIAGDEWADKTQGKFIRWALTWGKRIVVLTELVVIMAFLSRFWLDTMVAEQSEKIDAKKSVVINLADAERRFRVLASRVEKAETIENSTSLLTIYDRVLELIPEGATFDQISLQKNTVAFGGECSEQVLLDLIDAFRQSKDFTDITVERVAKTSSVNIVGYSFRATYDAN